MHRLHSMLKLSNGGGAQGSTLAEPSLFLEVSVHELATARTGQCCSGTKPSAEPLPPAPPPAPPAALIEPPNVDAEAFVRNAIEAALRAVSVVEESAYEGVSVIGRSLFGAFARNQLDKYRNDALSATQSRSGPLLHL